MLGLVPASVELRADASVPTRLLSRLLACLLFARSRALKQAGMSHVRKLQAFLTLDRHNLHDSNILVVLDGPLKA